MDGTADDSDEENIIIDDDAKASHDELIVIKNDDELLAYEAVKTAQIAQLNQLREQQRLDEENAAPSELIDHRLAYLMKQSEIFSHFMVGEVSDQSSAAPQRSRKRKSSAGATAGEISSKSSLSSKKAVAPGTGRGRRQKSEEEEDLELMKAADSKGVVTWLNAQPSCIVGGAMRPCKYFFVSIKLSVIDKF